MPDRFAESAGEVDLGNFGAALFADSGLGALVAVTVGGAVQAWVAASTSAQRR